MERIRVAVVGAAEWLVRYHLPALQTRAEADGLEIAGIWNRTQEKAARVAERFAISHVYPTLDALLSDPTVDAIVSVVSKEASFEILSAVAEKGVPILTEKPPAESAGKAEELARRVSVPAIVAFNRRYVPFHERFVSRVRELDALDAVSCSLHRRNRDDPTFVVETCVHGIDFLSYLGGRFEQISTERRRCAHGEVRSSFVLGRLEGGTLAQLSLLPFAGRACEHYEAYTRDVSLRLDIAQAYMDTASAAREEWANRGPGKPPDHRRVEEPQESTHPAERQQLERSGYLEIYREFAELVRGGIAEGRSTLHSAAAALRVAEAIDQGYSGPL